MSVFSNKDIIEAHESGHIVIEPFVQANVRKASLDLTLGDWFYRGASSEEGGIYNPFDEADVLRNYDGPFQAKPYFNVWRKMRELKNSVWYDWPVPEGAHVPWSPEITGSGLVGIPANHPIIMLMPGEFILAHSNEFAGIRPPGTTMMKARSSWGRNRVSACLCAGLGDPGYFSRWTLEIHNFSCKAIPLPIGERIAQLQFFETGEVYGGQYGQENGYRSKYQESADVAEVIAAWRPQDMLPRSYMDERRLPDQVIGRYPSSASSSLP